MYFIEEITNNQRVVDLMKNNYGNYVVQKALKLSTGMAKKNLINHIIRNLEKIGDRKLTMKWKTIIDTHMGSLVNENMFNQSAPLFNNNNNMSFNQPNNRWMNSNSSSNSNSFYQVPMNNSFNNNSVYTYNNNCNLDMLNMSRDCIPTSPNMYNPNYVNISNNVDFNKNYNMLNLNNHVKVNNINNMNNVKNINNMSNMSNMSNINNINNVRNQRMNNSYYAMNTNQNYINNNSNDFNNSCFNLTTKSQGYK